MKSNEVKTGIPNKTVKLNLAGLDGNAYSLMGAFMRQAKREGWSQEVQKQRL